MTVYEKSRYENQYVFQDDQNPNVVFIDPIREPRFSPDKDDFQIQLKEGDRLDILAYEFYGDAEYEWVLMDANPTLINPLDIKPGEYINIPQPDRVLDNV